jgi:multiple sugar transport system substrate-binding protein
VQLPAGPGGEGTMNFTVCYGVAADNEHPEESWALVNFLTGAEGSTYVAEQSFGVMPPRASAAEAWTERFPEQTAFVEGVENAHPWKLPVGFQEFVSAFNDSLQQAIAGQMLPEDVTAAAQEAGEDIMSRTEASS